MNISVDLNEEDMKLVRNCAQKHGVTISEYVRRSVLESIENELDLKAYHEAIDEYRKNPVTYSLEEIEKEINNDIQG